MQNHKPSQSKQANGIFLGNAQCIVFIEGPYPTPELAHTIYWGETSLYARKEAYNDICTIWLGLAWPTQ
ncbi:hypothetical protein [Ktedonosporobacter rubrisoli]|uniref:hypothetical protein n=1 Tax=Ktedonosporobacter rubrisoli TaxID=2509675 RepID=UPI0013EE7522|nr:hypothetical protein [Ktedonosporobacter rubrisoli]